MCLSFDFDYKASQPILNVSQLSQRFLYSAENRLPIQFWPLQSIKVKELHQKHETPFDVKYFIK